MDLNLFTDAFPVDDIITGVTDGIPGIDLTMSELAWVGDTVAEGVAGPSGGLNYTHGEGCTETGITGVHQHYCLTGSAAMGYDHPVVLRTVSEPVNLRFLDLLAANIDDPTVDDFLTTVQDDDLRRIMEAGFAASLNPPNDVLNAIVPEQLGGTELQVSVVLPSWVVTESAMTHFADPARQRQQRGRHFRRGPEPWQWDHEIKDGEQVLCAATQRTCVLSSVELDFETFDLHEWRQAVSVEFGLEVRVDMHRLAFLENITSPDDPVRPIRGDSIRPAALGRGRLEQHGRSLAWRSPSPSLATISIGTTRSATNPCRSRPRKKASRPLSAGLERCSPGSSMRA